MNWGFSILFILINSITIIGNYYLLQSNPRFSVILVQIILVGTIIILVANFHFILPKLFQSSSSSTDNSKSMRTVKFLSGHILIHIFLIFFGLATIDYYESYKGFGKLQLRSISYEQEKGVYKVHLETIVHSKGGLSKWEAEYANQTFTSPHKNFSIIGRASYKPGILGGTLKKIYRLGGTITKLKEYHFGIKPVKGHFKVKLKGTIKDPIAGSINFQLNFDLK